MRAIVLGLAVLLAGCDNPLVSECESHIKSKLKAPSSYKRVTASVQRMTTLSPQQDWVSIDYDAVNSFNAPLRDSHICKFSVRDWPDRGELQPDEADIPVVDSTGT